MRLTQEEITETGLHLQALIAEMQAAGRATPPPKFALSGPCSLMARFRPRSTFPAERAVFPFIGGEQFTLQAVVATDSGHDDSVEIEVLMSAASASLAAKGVTSVRMPLMDAIGYFDDLEEFAAIHMRDATVSSKAGSTPVLRVPPKRPAPTAEHIAARGTW